LNAKTDTLGLKFP